MATKKRSVGRPKKVVSHTSIKRMAEVGCTDEEIAFALGVSSDTIVRNFAEHLKKGRANLDCSLRHHQVKLAKEGNATMLIWLGKNRLGQSDQHSIANAKGKDGEPVPFRIESSTPEDNELRIQQLLDKGKAK